MMTFDRILQPLARLIENLNNQVRYHGVHKATVVAQHSNGTLDIQPVESTWAPLQNVPIYNGLAGTTVQVKAQTTCLFTFIGGSPQLPIVTGFVGQGAYSTITFNNPNGGQSAVLRLADSIGGGTLVLASADSTLTYTAPDGTTTVSPPNTITLTGKPNGGNPNVLA